MEERQANEQSEGHARIYGVQCRCRLRNRPHRGYGNTEEVGWLALLSHCRQRSPRKREDDLLPDMEQQGGSRDVSPLNAQDAIPHCPATKKKPPQFRNYDGSTMKNFYFLSSSSSSSPNDDDEDFYFLRIYMYMKSKSKAIATDVEIMAVVFGGS